MSNRLLAQGKIVQSNLEKEAIEVQEIIDNNKIVDINKTRTATRQ